VVAGALSAGTSQAEGTPVKLLKLLVNLIVATLVGALGDSLLGAWGLVLGFVAGGIAGWWVVRQFDF
jgi:hypothetical protein